MKFDSKRKRPKTMRAKALSILIASLFPVVVYAASGSVIDGHVNDSQAHKPLQSVVVKIKETGASVVTKDDGAFSFENIAPGSYTLVVEAVGQPVIERKVI